MKLSHNCAVPAEAYESFLETVFRFFHEQLDEELDETTDAEVDRRDNSRVFEPLAKSVVPADWRRPGLRQRLTAQGRISGFLQPEQSMAAFEWVGFYEEAACLGEAYFLPTRTKGWIAGFTLRSWQPRDWSSHPFALLWSALPWSALPPDWRQSHLREEMPLASPVVPDFLQILGQCLSEAEIGRAGADPFRRAFPSGVPATFLMEDVRQARRQAGQLRSLADEQAQEIEQLRSELQEAKDQWALLGRSYANDGDDEAPRRRESDYATAPQAKTLSLSDLPQWAHAHQDEIIVHPRALNAAKKSEYLYPEHLFSALDFLATEYRSFRHGELSRADLESALVRRGLRLSGSTVPSVAGEKGESYFVSWNGRRRFLESHILKGGGRDPRYCLRVYFFWSAEDDKVVCGYLPGHLDNSLT